MSNIFTISNLNTINYLYLNIKLFFQRRLIESKIDHDYLFTYRTVGTKVYAPLLPIYFLLKHHLQIMRYDAFSKGV